jgi:hypothetical protein
MSATRPTRPGWWLRRRRGCLLAPGCGPAACSQGWSATSTIGSSRARPGRPGSRCCCTRRSTAGGPASPTPPTTPPAAGPGVCCWHQLVGLPAQPSLRQVPPLGDHGPSGARRHHQSAAGVRSRAGRPALPLAVQPGPLGDRPVPLKGTATTRRHAHPGARRTPAAPPRLKAQPPDP